MGEIADAIRRARSGGLAAPAELRLPGLSRRAAEAPGQPSAALRRAPAGGGSLERLEPRSESIALEEGPNAEAARHVALRLRAELEARAARSVAVVSAMREEGKTTMACNLAIALATLSQEREVALVDLDLRRPSVAASLSLPLGPDAAGVENVLLGEATLDDVCFRIGKPTLDVYPVAVPQRAAHELLVLPAFGEMIAQLGKRYALVVVDTPPALVVPDALLILGHVASCVPIVRAGRTRARHLRQLVGELPQGCSAGVVLNDTRPTYRRDYDDYYYSGADPEGSGARRGRSDPA